jgi:hypothetical protein
MAIALRNQNLKAKLNLDEIAIKINQNIHPVSLIAEKI